MGLRSPPIAQALRRFDPYPEFDNVRVFKGRPETGGRQFYKTAGLIVPRFEMVPGVQIIGGAGFGQREINAAWRGARADEPLIGDGGLRNAEARTQSCTIALTNPTPADAASIPISGADAANANITAVDDSHELAKVGFTGRAYRLDNSAGTATAFASLPNSAVSAGVLTAFSAFCRGGAGQLRNSSSSAEGSVSFTASATYQRRACEMTTAAPRTPTVVALAGEVVFFIAPQVKPGPDINDPPILQTSGLPATRTGYSYRETGLSIAPVHYGVARARLVAPVANHAASFPVFFDLRPATGGSRMLWYVPKSDGLLRFAATADNGTAYTYLLAAPVVGEYDTIAWARRGETWAISFNGGAVDARATSVIAAPLSRLGYMGDAAIAGANSSNAEMDIFATWNGEISNAALQALSARFAA